MHNLGGKQRALWGIGKWRILVVVVERVGFGRLCSKKKRIMPFAVLVFFLEIMPKLCYFLKIMTETTEINTYRAFLFFDTPIRKIGFYPERDSNPRLPDYLKLCCDQNFAT